MNGVKDDVIRLTKDMLLRYIQEKDIDCFTYEVFEGNEPEYDEYGNRRYYICVAAREGKMREKSFPIFLCNYPEVDKILVRPRKVDELNFYRYSPNKGVSFRVKMSFTLLYRDGENEIEVGTIGTKKQSWVIDKDGNATMME